MQFNLLVRKLTFTAMLLMCAGAVQAQEAPLDFTLPSQSISSADSFMLLAANEATTPANTPAKTVSSPKASSAEFEPPLISGSNTHLYLGLATIAAAALTAVTAPGEGCEHGPCGPQPPRDINGTHAKLAKATVALAAATIATGVIVHWNDFHFEDGFTDPDNLHAMLGITGAALMAYAVNKSAASTVKVSHAGVAELGALGMIVAIKLTW